MILIQLVLVLGGAGVVYGAYKLLKSYPAYRHHVVPAVAIAMAVFANFFPVVSETKYIAKVGKLQFVRASEVSFQGELVTKRIFLKCDGLSLKTQEVLVRKDGQGKTWERVRDLNLTLAAGGQWEIGEIEPAYLPVDVSYSGENDSAWGFEARDVADGLSLQLPPKGLKKLNILHFESLELKGKAFTARADGRTFWDVAHGPGAIRLQSRGKFPIELDNSKCANGYFEFVLGSGDSEKLNRLMISSSQYVLKDPKLGEIRKIVKSQSGRSVEVLSRELEERGLVQKIRNREFVLKDGSVELEFDVSGRDSLLGKYRDDALLAAILAILVFWVSQIVTHNWKIEEKKDRRSEKK